MKIRLRYGLPFVSATIHYRSQRVTLKNILLDTGSAGSIFSTDKVLPVGLTYEPDDMVHRIRGVGGSEFVFTKRVDRLRIGDLSVTLLQKGCFATETTEFFEFFSRVFSVNSVAELVFAVDSSVALFEIEIGAMDYGFDIDGIIGMDFLKKVGAVLNLNNMEILSS